MMKKSICIISEKAGHSLTKILVDNFILLGYADRLKIYDDIQTKDQLITCLNNIFNNPQSLIYYIFEDIQTNEFISEFCEEKGINSFDIHSLTFGFFYSLLSCASNAKDLSNSIIREIDQSILDFAIETDDGKRPESILEADIVIIGVSRTTKTPLSIYMSNNGLKVTNIPLLPEIDPPKELFKIDPDKIFALMMDEDRLLGIRKTRLDSLGLPHDSPYASLARINHELSYAKKVIDKIGCRTIDVSFKSIEETSDVIMNILHKKRIRKG